MLIWHGRLLHRGLPAKQRGAERRALIARYAEVDHRPDMPKRCQEFGVDEPLH